MAALAIWLALGWPFLQELTTGTMRGSFPVPQLWLLPFAFFGAAVVAAIVLRDRTVLRWNLLFAQLAAVVAMTILHPKDLMAIFLVVIAWQVAVTSQPVKALGWVAIQTLAVIITLEQSPNAHLTYIMALSILLQLCCVFTAQALRAEARASHSLAQANGELRSAHAIIANDVRTVERLRVSRGLHDAWHDELTALSSRLEAAVGTRNPRQLNDHVSDARELSRGLLAKVREVVSALRTGDDPGEGSPSTTRRERADSLNLVGTERFGRLDRLGNWHQMFLPVAALAVALALGWPVIQMFTSGKVPVSAPWLIAFGMFGAALLSATVLKLRPRLLWALLCVEVAAVAAMAYIVSWAMMSAFLIIIAWQVATLLSPAKALGWVAFQTLVVVGSLALAPNPDLCWVLGKSVALQLFFVFAAQSLKMESDTTRALAATNRELRTAEAIIATSARDAERLRISRELHDAWGHELTALGLQLEIASHSKTPRQAREHVLQAKVLATALLDKVRDVVATLRDAELTNVELALETLAKSVPVPTVHVAIAPGVQVDADQAHALIRCAQEAVTNTVRHAEAKNLWLEVRPDGDGVRLVARDDGRKQVASTTQGSGLLGMRERVENLGGRLAVGKTMDLGFTVDAWLPSGTPQAA